MSTISRFEIRGLHGHQNLDFRLKDNSLIIVGENGAGKTTVLHLFYYLVSGQWNSLAKYKWETLAVTIDNKRHVVKANEILEWLRKVDIRLEKRLPPHLRGMVREHIIQGEGALVSPQLERICEQYGIPLQYLFRELAQFPEGTKKNSDQLRLTLSAISTSIDAQILYLPTYRRIEQELSLIFSDFDERESESRRRKLSSRKGETFVELVEFGMKDVDNAISETLAQLERFTRENLTALTFSYLGDIVEEQYQSVEFDIIRTADHRTIESVLGRIPESMLSAKNKQHLKSKIEKVQSDKAQDIHAKVICHYFTKLMAFHQQLEKREMKIRGFCNSCNAYMVDKQLHYDSTNYSVTIQRNKDDRANSEIGLQHLSSGEKQIVSLFSHLYLSGSRRYFVVIDEPELSLSVVWQRKFLQDIKNSHLCAGILAVTHSPFIYDNSLRTYAHGIGEFVV